MSTTGLTRVGIRAARSSHRRSARVDNNVQRRPCVKVSAWQMLARPEKQGQCRQLQQQRDSSTDQAASWRGGRAAAAPTDVSREALVHILHARQLGGGVEGVACGWRAGRAGGRAGGQQWVCATSCVDQGTTGI
jgi:hypothetical protein